MPVGKGDLLVRHLHPKRRGAGQAAPGNLRVRKPAAGPRIHHLPVTAVGCAGGVQLAAAAKAGVDKPLFQQDIVILLINPASLALVDGRGRTVGGKPQPRQIIHNRVGVHARAAHGVQILNAQKHLPALAFGAQPCQQAAHQVAKVHPPAGAGGIASGGHSKV